MHEKGDKMSYSINIIKKANQKITSWSGGTTTELAIYPTDAQYSKRNFKWRLSSARVELEKSTFTQLPGIWRYIMVIGGEMDLEHQGHHSVHLKPFEKDSFSGSWTTKSRGKVRDFNLMVADGYRGEIKSLDIMDVLSIKESNLKNYCKSITQAFYCIEGSVKIEIDGSEKITIEEGDMALISIEGKPGKIKILNLQSNPSKVINAAVYN